MEHRPIREGMERQGCEVEEVLETEVDLGVAGGAGDQHSRADGTEDPHSGAEDHQGGAEGSEDHHTGARDHHSGTGGA